MENESKSELRTELATLGLTDGMPPATVDRLAQIARGHTYAAGKILFNESDRYDQIHIICEGLVTLEMRVPGHDVQKILTLGRGELLGWSALLADGVMTTSAVATQTTTTIEFDTRELKLLCEQDHEVGYYVMRQVATSLAKRLLSTRLQLLDLFRG